MSSSWIHFGASFGAQNVCARGVHFSSWPLLAPLGLILASSWPLLAPLGPSWPLLASSWLHFGSILTSLGLSIRLLGPLLALILASSWLHRSFHLMERHASIAILARERSRLVSPRLGHGLFCVNAQFQISQCSARGINAISYLRLGLFSAISF